MCVCVCVRARARASALAYACMFWTLNICVRLCNWRSRGMREGERMWESDRDKDTDHFFTDLLHLFISNMASWADVLFYCHFYALRSINSYRDALLQLKSTAATDIQNWEPRSDVAKATLAKSFNMIEPCLAAAVALTGQLLLEISFAWQVRCPWKISLL